MSITAMKLALEAIEVIADSDLSGTDLTVAGYMAHAFAAKAREASITLRQAIAEAEQANPAANSNCELCGQWNSTLNDGVCRNCERKYK